ncbi:unnamed protein product, partial [Effrenium voratum]
MSNVRLGQVEQGPLDGGKAATTAAKARPRAKSKMKKDDAQPAEGQPAENNGSEQQVSGLFESKDDAEAKIDDADKTQEQKQPEPSEQSDEKTTGASAHVEVNSEADQKVEPAQEPDVEADKKKKQAKAKAASRNQPKKRAAKEAWQTKNAWGCQELPGAFLLCCD